MPTHLQVYLEFLSEYLPESIVQNQISTWLGNSFKKYLKSTWRRIQCVGAGVEEVRFISDPPFAGEPALLVKEGRKPGNNMTDCSRWIRGRPIRCQRSAGVSHIFPNCTGSADDDKEPELLWLLRKRRPLVKMLGKWMCNLNGFFTPEEGIPATSFCLFLMGLMGWHN